MEFRPEDSSRLLQQLQDAAATLEEDLRREIASCHEELLLCATGLQTHGLAYGASWAVEVASIMP